MRLDLPRLKDRFGSVLYYGLQSVYELDSGMVSDEMLTGGNNSTLRIPYEKLHTALSNMAIVVPVKGEKLRLLEGVLMGIPNPVQIIIVSNSDRTPVDNFQLEKDMAQNFAAITNRDVICVHQKDPKLAHAFVKSGYRDLIGKDGLLRSGKAEGMIIGTMLAKLSGRRTVGFVDADNYFPGAVLEYCNLYAAGFAMSRRKDHAMVRISWSSKPKVRDNDLYFSKWGRSSIVTNTHMNKLVSSYTGFESESIRTGNAGEHAMTVDLAMTLGWSAGYSIEPYQLVYLMEQFGGELNTDTPAHFNRPVNVYQLESRNPHLHESKGEEHVEKMIEASLSVIYHSPLANDRVKAAIQNELDKRGIRPAGEEIPVMRKYPPLNTLDYATFRETLRGGGYIPEAARDLELRPA